MRGKRFLPSLLSLFLIIPFIFISCATGQKVKPDIIIVAQTGGNYTTIREATAHAREGQVIKIRGGVYHEAVEITTPRIVVEAWDPAAEPVIIDGADQTFLNTAHVWEPMNENVWSTDYQWPLDPPGDEEYSTPTGTANLFQVYEDGTLLRGYRDPFDERMLRTKKPLRPFGADYGLAGAYASVAELDPLFRAGRPVSHEIKPEITRTGRFLYDASQKKLMVWTAGGDAPVAHEYAIPVLPHLVTIKAPNVTIKNIILKHATDYAIDAAEADGGTIEGCTFSNAHFAISLARTRDFTITNNVIEEHGFWERYSSYDVAGTLYERSAVSVEPTTDGRQITVENNIIRGTPFTLSPLPGKLSVSLNVIAYSVFGLFSPRYPQKAGFAFELEIHDNIVHHLDNGIGNSFVPDDRGRILMYRNCFYLGAAAFETGQTEGPFLKNVVFYNNTVILAGETPQTPFPNILGSPVTAFNNLFYARNILFTIFVDTGEGTPSPVIAGPLLSASLFFTPSDGGGELLTFRMQDATYVYKKATPPDGSADNAAGKNPAKLFSHDMPLADIEFFHKEFNNGNPIDSNLIYKNTAAEFIKVYRIGLLSPFLLFAKSPARDIGRKSGSDLPDSLLIEDGKIDIGAVEFY
jgi:parallel beta-helix repeat protein